MVVQGLRDDLYVDSQQHDVRPLSRKLPFPKVRKVKIVIESFELIQYYSQLC